MMTMMMMMTAHQEQYSLWLSLFDFLPPWNACLSCSVCMKISLPYSHQQSEIGQYNKFIEID